MNHVVRPVGVCPNRIAFDIEGDIVKNISFNGGCNGNLKAIAALVNDMPVKDVISKLEGIKCGFKSTSCADQLAKALKEAQ